MLSKIGKYSFLSYLACLVLYFFPHTGYASELIWTTKEITPAPNFTRIVLLNNKLMSFMLNGQIVIQPTGGKSSMYQLKMNSYNLQNLGDIAYGKGIYVAVGGTTIMSSTDGISWVDRANTESIHMNSVAYGNGKFVAVGESPFNTWVDGTIQTSSDGISWKQESTEHLVLESLFNSKFIPSFKSIVFSNGQFVAVGKNAYTYPGIYTSPDGVIWTESKISASDPTSQFNSITYGNRQYVAVGDKGLIFTSYDAKTWTQREAGIEDNIMKVVYANGTYAAIGQNEIITSSNGKEWHVSPKPFASVSDMVATNGGVIIVGETGIAGASINTNKTGTLVANTDMISKNEPTKTTGKTAGSNANNIIQNTNNKPNITIPTTQPNKPIIKNTVVGAPTYPSTPVNLTLNAVSPTQINLDWKLTIVNARYYNIYRSEKPNFNISPDTKVGSVIGSPFFSGQLNPSTTYYYKITAVNSDGESLPSNEVAAITLKMPGSSLKWSSVSTQITDYPLMEVVWAQNQFIAVGQNILTSSDGRNWVSRYFEPNWANRVNRNRMGTSLLWSIAWSGTRFVTVGQSVILTSSDGISWSSQTPDGIAKPYYLTRVIWSGSQFIAVGASGIILTSPDGAIWTIRKSGVTSDLFNIIWSGSQFVAVGAGETIITSPDGVNWNIRQNNISMNNLWALCFAQNKFIAGGEFGKILTSNDGINWTSTTINSLSSGGSIKSIVWTGQQFVAVGSPETFVSSDGINWAADPNMPMDVNRVLFSITNSGNSLVAVGGYLFQGEMTGTAIFTSP